MKFSSSSLRPAGRLATMRAATMALVVSAFLLGVLMGGGLRQTAWANVPTSTAIATATIEATATHTPTLPTIPAGRNLTPVIGTQTPAPNGYNLPAFSCGDGGTVKRLEWTQNLWTVTLDCPNLRFKVTAAGVSD